MVLGFLSRAVLGFLMRVRVQGSCGFGFRAPAVLGFLMRVRGSGLVRFRVFHGG